MKGRGIFAPRIPFASGSPSETWVPVSSLSPSLRVGYAIGKQVRAYVDVFNLLDRKASDIDYFYASRLQGEPAGGVSDVHFHPVEPRALRATLALAY